MITMLRDIKDKMFLTKGKEVAAFILDYDSNKKAFAAQVNGKNARIALEDISLYPKSSMRNDDIDNSYLDRILGKKVSCEVIGYDDEYILSRAKLMQRKVEKYEKGDTVIATVKSASDRALYLEFDEGLSGIMYINQLTSAKVKKPSDIYSVNDTIACKIIKKRDSFFELSRIEFYKDVDFKIQLGDTVKCKITKKLDDNTGYFVEVLANPLYCGIFDLNNYNKNRRYKVGDTIDLRVAKVKANNQLSLRTTC